VSPRWWHQVYIGGAIDGSRAVAVGSRYHPTRQYLSGEEWTAQAGRASEDNSPRVFVVDTNGHFVAALVACIDGQMQIVVFNTTQGTYLPSPIFDFMHEVLVAPSASEAATSDASASQTLAA
jgi:hypothetical protein